MSDGAVGLPVESGGVHLIALLEFDSVEAIQQALASPEGQATVADRDNFADGGVDLMVFNTKTVCPLPHDAGESPRRSSRRQEAQYFHRCAAAMRKSRKACRRATFFSSSA